jgi:alpha-L-rhamnosidase
MVDYNTVVNAFQYATLRRMAGIARVLEKDAEALAFDQRADALYASFNLVFWDEAQRRYVDGEGTSHSSQHANLFPLALGLVPAERVDDVRDFVVSRNMACSVYAAHYLLEGLFANGGEDHAVDLMRSTLTRSWYNMIRAGSTITMEAWDQSFKSNLDWNHAWGAAPAAAIPRWVLGVRPASPGWTDIIVSPHLGRLAWIEGTVPTLRGGVDVRVVKEGTSGLSGQISVPPGCRIYLELPLPPGAVGELLLNGKPVAATAQGNRLRLADTLPAGAYTFEVR